MRKIFKKIKTGDIIITKDEKIVKVDSGDVDVFDDGTYKLYDGHLMYVDKDAILSAQATHNEIVDLSNLND